MVRNNTKRNLRLASFDGGGPRCFSQLMIMENIMHRLMWDIKPTESDKTLLPCDYFDLIGGSDTGGLLVIMLVRLRMSLEDTMLEFSFIVEAVYKMDLQPKERTERLRKCMENLLARRGQPLDLKLESHMQDDGCLGFVLASSSRNLRDKIRLRTYIDHIDPPSSITVGMIRLPPTKPG
ncbi:hypothetical protein M408DRAFT_332561 [Serendipita vermifera MAFF 305830]|uniref:PNPLA domain-containing protein n=1 Tax=Serendipita vermifera MAFF 305830 TaxID=933852 RepID=A0A0C3AEQ7_SERVB|nr:hypothetical protein M408DRAFT_332561 [Serendipita vermifera MAFF 305830]